MRCVYRQGSRKHFLFDCDNEFCSKRSHHSFPHKLVFSEFSYSDFKFGIGIIKKKNKLSHNFLKTKKYRLLNKNFMSWPPFYWIWWFWSQTVEQTGMKSNRPTCKCVVFLMPRPVVKSQNCIEDVWDVVKMLELESILWLTVTFTTAWCSNRVSKHSWKLVPIIPLLWIIITSRWLPRPHCIEAPSVFGSTLSEKREGGRKSQQTF